MREHPDATEELSGERHLLGAFGDEESCAEVVWRVEVDKRGDAANGRGKDPPIICSSAGACEGDGPCSHIRRIPSTGTTARNLVGYAVTRARELYGPAAGNASGLVAELPGPTEVVSSGSSDRQSISGAPRADG
ncbi:hypothetical protein [Streptomyces erythrochromogenes]|uniref:hypothetical protein n=1 Tax=Streptomyces erythrochromogenes TaxID=285574 RepID=UPI00386C54E4|nr:hypothetical protein OG364_36260 [Streptomyces erythrochromogenes]